jgi:hypothetical protein
MGGVPYCDARDYNPVQAGVVRSSHTHCPSAALLPAPTHAHLCLCSSMPPLTSHHRLSSAAEATVRRRCLSVPRRHATILPLAQCLISADKRSSAGRAASMLDLHLCRAASTPATPNSDAAGFFGELQSPPSRRSSESPVTSRAAGLLMHPALSC